MKNLLCLFFAAILMALLSHSFDNIFSTERNMVALASQSPLTEYTIPPEVTDSTIDGWLNAHYVAINKSVPAKPKLFIFLPATGAQPRNYRLIVQ